MCASPTKLASPALPATEECRPSAYRLGELKAAIRPVFGILLPQLAENRSRPPFFADGKISFVPKQGERITIFVFPAGPK
jgi:hypothetical protein